MTKDEADAFAVALNALAGESRRADRATIKRARTGHETQRILARRIYHQLVPIGLAHTRWTMDLVERVASLFVLNPLGKDTGEGLGNALRTLAHRPEVSSDAVDRRFTVLLAAGPDTLDTHLARFFTRLHGAGVPVDYAQLTLHLQNVDHPSRWVQRRWADEFWGPHSTSDTDIEQTTGATS